MKKILLLLALGILFVSCSSDTQKVTKEVPSVTLIKPITIPFREHAYAGYPSKVLTTQAELDTFLRKVSNDSSWNKKTSFLAKIKNENIDFKSDNLVFYRMTEGSGSVKVSVKNDDMRLANNEVRIVIERNVPEVGTSDMAYYAIAYRVSKSLKNIIFEDGMQSVIVKNQKSNMVVPENCEAWFDGCNHCTKGGGCTRMACIVYRPEDFRCKKWKK